MPVQQRDFSELFRNIARDMGARDDAVLREAVWFAKNNWTSTDFSPINLCGYFYRYAQLSAGLIECRMREALGGCDELQGCFGGDRVVNVVILGSGGGTDIIGLLNALYETNLRCRGMNITLVDIQPGWRDFARCLVQRFSRGDCGTASQAYTECNTKVSFFCRDATVDDPAYIAELGNADVILMPRLLSTLPFRDIDKVRDILVENMRTGAALIVVDSPGQFGGHLQLENLYYPDENIDYVVAPHIQEMYGYQISPQSNNQIYVYRKIMPQNSPEPQNVS